MDTDNLEFQLSEADEYIVRSYECTRLKRLFAPEALGRLTITNKRIVYHGHGGPPSGRSVLVKEMPVEDAAGVSVYMGATRRWLLCLALAIGLSVASLAVDYLLPLTFPRWPLGLALMLPYIAARIQNRRSSSDKIRQRQKGSPGSLPAATGRSAAPDPAHTIVHAMFWVGVAILAWNLPQWFMAVYFNWGFGLGRITYLLMLPAYLLIFVLVLGRQEVFTLVIGSRTMQGSGIQIPGASSRLFGKRAEADALGGTPAADAARLAREIGALLSDLRQFGDLAARKWQAN
jgi:hypothetical protein